LVRVELLAGQRLWANPLILIRRTVQNNIHLNSTEHVLNIFLPLSGIPVRPVLFSKNHKNGHFLMIILPFLCREMSIFQAILHDRKAIS